MTRWFSSLLLVLAAIVLGGLWRPARAGDAGFRYALLVGCGNYRKTEFKALPYTGNDVLGFKDALLATGFEPGGVVVLHDRAESPRFQPERAKILEELDLLTDSMTAADTLVVALSGHGLQYKGDPVSYFVPIDGKLADKKTLIPLNGPGGLYEKLKACKARKKLLIVNACRNDPTVSLDFASNQIPLADEDRPNEVPEGIAAIYSCQAGQKSYYDDNRKVALFYEHLTRAWKGAYAGGGEVTLEDVFRQVTVKTKLDALNSLGAKQTPQVYRDYRGEWVIVPGRTTESPLVREMKFVRIPRGTTWMGGGSHVDPATREWKKRPPQQQVKIDYHYELAAYCVTQGQWQAVMGNNPSWFSRQGKGKDKVASIPDAELARFPVESVSWEDAQEFVKKFNGREAGKGWTYRLPKETEWEYACRNAAQSMEECAFDFYFANGSYDLSSVDGNIDNMQPAGNGVKQPRLERTRAVGCYLPNRLGLYDMHGNVWQWCADSLEKGEARRAVRGGAWTRAGVTCRAASRIDFVPSHRSGEIGFRLARVRARG